MAVSLISDIIEKVKRRANIPDATTTYTSPGLLSFAQEALTETVFPWLVGINEEFCVVEQTFPCLDQSGVAIYPNAVIPFPARAWGRNLREVKYIDNVGNVFNCPLANLEERDLFLRAPTLSRSFTNAPTIYVQGDQIVALTNPDTLIGSFWFVFPVQPPTISTSTTLHAEITDISHTSGTTSFTVNATGADFNTYCTNTTKRFDIFRRDSGATIKINVVCARSGTSTTLTTTDLSEDDAVNLKSFQQGGMPATQYSPSLLLLPAEQNNYAPLPPELENLFVLATCGRYLESVGDTEGLAVTEAKMREAERAAGKALGKRITGEPKIITNRRGIRAFLSSQTYRRGW